MSPAQEVWFLSKGRFHIAAASTPESTGAYASAAPTPFSPRSARLSGGAAGWVLHFPPIYAVAIAIVAGDGLGNFRIFFPFWVAAALVSAAVALFCLRRRGAAMAAALIAIVAAGTFAVKPILVPPADPLSVRNVEDGTLVTLEGRLVREAERFPDKTRIYVEALRMGAQPAAIATALAPSRGLVRVTILHPQAFALGDQVRLSGHIHFPRNLGDPGEFDYAGFMARQGIAATITPSRTPGRSEVRVLAHHRVFPGSAIESIRNRLAASIDRDLDDPAAAEMRALILGDRGGIDEQMHEVFGRTGMAHLLVISGLHLSMVAAAVFGVVRLLILLFPLPAARGWANKTAAIAAALAVCAYAAIAGNHVSTLRALIMVLAYMIAVVLDRPREAIASLALAAIIICLALPGSSADIGFQLSFASVLTIILGMRRYVRWVARRRRARNSAGASPSRGEIACEWGLSYLAVSFWAMLGVAPLTAYYFNQFSLVGLVANAIVVPIMALGGTVVGLAAAAVSLIAGGAAWPLFRLAGKFLSAGNLLAYWFVDWPLAWVRVFTPTPIEVALWYAALLMWLLRPPRGGAASASQPEPSGAGPARRPLGQWRHAAVVAIALIAVIDAGWWLYHRYFDPDLRITFLSVGEGDAAVVRFPGSRVMLVDGGPAWRDFDTGERVVARYLWSQKIMRVDWLALSHPDQDHFGGFDYVAQNFNPREFWTVPSDQSEESYTRLLATLHSLKVPIKMIDDRMPSWAANGVTVTAMNPPPEFRTKRNDTSMVLRIEFAGTSFLFTGDLEAAGEQTVIAGGHSLRSTVLKVPHHGSRTSSTLKFLQAVHPAAAVISLGYHNRFHFPAPEVIGRYSEEGVRVFRTDREGAIMVDAGPRGASIEAFSSRIAAGLNPESDPSLRLSHGAN